MHYLFQGSRIDAQSDRWFPNKSWNLGTNFHKFSSS